MAEKIKDNEVKVIPYRKEDRPRVYSNYVRIASSGHDITLQFSDVKPPDSDEETEEIMKKKELRVPIDVEIALPIEVAKSLINILKEQMDKLTVSKK